MDGVSLLSVIWPDKQTKKTIKKKTTKKPYTSVPARPNYQLPYHGVESPGDRSRATDRRVSAYVSGYFQGPTRRREWARIKARARTQRI